VNHGLTNAGHENNLAPKCLVRYPLERNHSELLHLPIKHMKLKEKNYLAILDGYFPPFTTIPTEKDQKLIAEGKMSLEDIEDPHFKLMFKKWLSEIHGNTNMEFAINTFMAKMNRRTNKDQDELLGHTLAVCFLAKSYETFRVKNPGQLREIYKETTNSLKSILRDLKKLQKSISSHEKTHTTMSVDPYIYREETTEIDEHTCSKNIQEDEFKILFQFLNPYNPKLADPQLSLSKLNELLDIYYRLLGPKLDSLTETVSSKDQGFIYYETGPLKYPKSLTTAQNLSNPELNGLIFNLALLFRQYTDTSNEEHWLTTRGGAMPNVGNACVGLIGSFVNATFPSDGFSAKQITDRLANLAKTNVKFTSW
jgi:hypothetical protein